MPLKYIFFLLGCMYLNNVMAQNSIEKKVISLEQLIDSSLSIGSFLELDIEHSPLSISIISAEQILNSGARHLSELLEIYIPGFQYMYNKWNGIIWGMRGVASDRNTKFIFLVNGRKMNHESRDGAFSELDLGFLSDLEKVEVLRGPAGLVYGSGSIAGVINLVTKKYTQDKKVIESAVESWSLKTFGTSDKLSFSQKLEGGSSIQLYAGFRFSQGSGPETPHIYGRPSYPYPQKYANPLTQAPPSVGSSWNTPGNFIFSTDYHSRHWRAYLRITHQVTNAAQFFVLDPWPDVNGVPDSNASPRMVDGNLVSPKGIYGQMESWGNSRRQYRVNNISAQVNRDFKWGKSQVKLNSGVDLVSSTIALQKLNSYSNAFATEREIEEVETFGEKRFNITGTYLFSKENFQFAAGIESKVFVFGNDLSGKNAQQEKANHPIIENTSYFNQAIYSEVIAHPFKNLMIDLGLRYDVHTRTLQYGGFLNPRIGLSYSVHPNWNLRTVYHSSGNYGSDDNYEQNRNTFNDQGQPYQEAHYETPTVLPNENSTPIVAVSQKELRNLQPEKAYSLEFSSYFKKNNLNIISSLSYNKIKDLFTWNQNSFRVINAGKYFFVNGEIDISYTAKTWSFGANHVLTRLVNTQVMSEKKTVNKTVFDENSYETRQINGQTYYYPVALKNFAGNDSTTLLNLYPVRDAISVDGRNFLNLSSNITKIYMDFAFSRYFSIHTDLRLFWGLPGRRDLINYRQGQTGILEDYAKDYQHNEAYPYLGIEKNMMAKWNAGVKISLNKGFLQLFIYDILSSPSAKNNINSIRWQQTSNSRTETDLYGLDFRCFAIKYTLLL